MPNIAPFYSTPFFVQIGLGVMAECVKLLDDGWRGALVECDPMSFAKMYDHLYKELETDQFHKLLFYHAIITGTDGIADLQTYTFDRDGFIPLWSHTCGSEHFIFDQPPNVHFKMPSISLDTLFNNLPLPVDFLMMDIGGHEIEVLSNYSYRHLPDVIQVEYHRGNADAIREILEPRGYEVIAQSDDNHELNERWLHKDRRNSPVSQISIWGYPFPDEARHDIQLDIEKGRFPSTKKEY